MKTFSKESGIPENVKKDTSRREFIHKAGLGGLSLGLLLHHDLEDQLA